MYMNNKAKAPFYRTQQWGIPSSHSQQQHHHMNKAPSKVVNIPVHFVGSERSRADSATKIQKVVRGFLVRNTVKRIKVMKFEVEEIEAKVRASSDLIRRDQRERLRVSETIMNLLLKLDSVRVLNYYSGVRECRKSVIKKAIALQEMVDQMVGSNDEEEGGKEEPHHGGGEDSESGSVAESQVEEEGLRSNLVDEEKNCLVEEEQEEGVCKNASEEKVVDGVDTCLVEEEEEEGVCKNVSEMWEADSQGESIKGLRNDEEEKMMEVEEKDEGGDVEVEESVGTSLVEENNCVVKEEEEEEEEENVEEADVGKREGGRDGKHKELLEKMMEENERMMGMMAQLFEKNEMQTRLLSSLSQRVEQLEKAFVCDKLRRCKKRRNNNASDATKQQKQTHPKNGSI